MLNGQCPFKAPTQKELFKKIGEGNFEYIVDISNEAKDLIESFLREDPSKRLSPY